MPARSPAKSAPPASARQVSAAKKVVTAKAAPAAKKVATAKAAPSAKKPAARDAVRTTNPTGPSGQEPKARKSAAKLGVGERAPDFALAADDGKTYALKDLKGSRVVLYFYPRDATPGCTTEACDFRDRQSAFAGAGVTVLGVSGDDLKSHARFRSKHALSFPLLSDPEHAVAAAYGAFGEKVLYGKTSVGILRSTFVIGPDGAIEGVWQPVRVPGHADAVLASVTAAR